MPATSSPAALATDVYWFLHWSNCHQLPKHSSICLIRTILLLLAENSARHRHYWNTVRATNPPSGRQQRGAPQMIFTQMFPKTICVESQRSTNAGAPPAAPLRDALVAADHDIVARGASGLEPESRLEHRRSTDRWVSSLLHIHHQDFDCDGLLTSTIPGMRRFAKRKRTTQGGPLHLVSNRHGVNPSFKTKKKEKPDEDVYDRSNLGFAVDPSLDISFSPQTFS